MSDVARNIHMSIAMAVNEMLKITRRSRGDVVILRNGMDKYAQEILEHYREIEKKKIEVNLQATFTGWMKYNISKLLGLYVPPDMTYYGLSHVFRAPVVVLKDPALDKKNVEVITFGNSIHISFVDEPNVNYSELSSDFDVNGTPSTLEEHIALGKTKMQTLKLNIKKESTEDYVITFNINKEGKRIKDEEQDEPAHNG